MRRPLVWHHEPGLFWVRLFGKGFYVKDIFLHPLNFSERNGYGRGWLVRRLR